MRYSAFQKFGPLSYLALILPFVLWGMVGLGINPGRPEQFFDPESLLGFINGFRAIAPFVASSIAAGVIVFKVSKRQPGGFGLFSPLGLAALYGAVGLVSALKSPDGSLAIHWASLYLTAPLVLWATVWNTEIAGRLWRLLNFTWLVIIAMSLTLFVVASVRFDLLKVVTDPATLVMCQSGNWVDLTSGQIRDTGVARYAAIGAIIAISGVWQGRQWPAWCIVFLTSFSLLIFTGARGAMLGFAIAAPLMVLIYGGKKALIAGITFVVLIMALWETTDVLNDFVYNCVFHFEERHRVFNQNRSADSEIPAAVSLAEETKVAEDAPEQTVAERIKAQPVIEPRLTAEHDRAPPTGTGSRQGDSGYAVIASQRSDSRPPAAAPQSERPVSTAIVHEPGQPLPTLAASQEGLPPEVIVSQQEGASVKVVAPQERDTLPTVAASQPEESLPTVAASQPEESLPTMAASQLEAPLPAVAASQEKGASLRVMASQKESPPPTITAAKQGNPTPTITGSDSGGRVENLAALTLSATPPVLPNSKEPEDEDGFFEFTGRMAVWKEGLNLLKDSPFIGFGFHADRLILGTHMHNSFMQALFQTGLLGSAFLVAAVLFAWVCFFKSLRKLRQLPEHHKHLVIQTGAILGFLTVRSLPESTGAFFGIDWLILAPIMLYLHVICSNTQNNEESDRLDQ